MIPTLGLCFEATSPGMKTSQTNIIRGENPTLLFLHHYEQSNHTLYWFSSPDEISEWGKGLLKAFSVQTNVEYINFLDKKNATICSEDAIVFFSWDEPLVRT